MEAFACCSHYIECSNKLKCLFEDDDHEGCAYKKNLENGKNYYRTIIDFPKIKPAVLQMDKIFIDCYERNFKIGRIDKRGLTFSLESDEIEIIHKVFTSLNIPIVQEANDEKCILEGDEIEPANSRLLFKIEGGNQIFSIGNYNGMSMLKRYADGIYKAMLKKGIKCEFEMSGLYAKIIKYNLDYKPRRYEYISKRYQIVEDKKQIDIIAALDKEQFKNNVIDIKDIQNNLTETIIKQSTQPTVESFTQISLFNLA